MKSTATIVDVTTGSETIPGLQVQGLTHQFGARRVVDDVSLAVGKGEIHCLVGPSGCGKTTSLRLIAGLEPIQAGIIKVGGRRVGEPGRELPPERRRVGLMFQDFALFPHLRVAENVAFGLGGRDREEKARRVDELLRRVNMIGFARAWPDTLSGGEQQRVALARALAPKPQLILLDEAFSALDATLRDAIRNDTLNLLRETGTPALLVTHDADEAVRAADRIHVMQAGRIVQSGPPAELYRSPGSAFVASFFGAVNRFAGIVENGAIQLPVGEVEARGLDERQAAEIIIRPEGVRLGSPARCGKVLAAVVECRDLGPVSLLTLGLPDGSRVSVRRHDAVSQATGQEVEIDLDPSHVFVYPATA